LIPTSLVPQMGGGNVSLDKDNNNWTPALLFLVFVSGIWMFPYYIGCDP